VVIHWGRLLASLANIGLTCIKVARDKDIIELAVPKPELHSKKFYNTWLRTAVSATAATAGSSTANARKRRSSS